MSSMESIRQLYKRKERYSHLVEHTEGLRLFEFVELTLRVDVRRPHWLFLRFGIAIFLLCFIGLIQAFFKLFERHHVPVPAACMLLSRAHSSKERPLAVVPVRDLADVLIR